MKNSSNNGKKWCVIITILTLTVGTFICTMFDEPSIALSVLYGTALALNTIIIENS